MTFKRTDDDFPAVPKGPFSYASQERVDESQIPQDAISQWADGRYLEKDGNSNNLAAGPFTTAPDSIVGLSGTALERFSLAAIAAFLAGATIPGALDITGNLDVGGHVTSASDISGSDFHANRAGATSTGIIYLGNNAGQSYLYFDGSNYYFGPVTGKASAVVADDFVLA